MRTYLALAAVLATSLGMSSLAPAAHGGGGGMHGGGTQFGGTHFGSSTHIAPPATVGRFGHHGGFDHSRFGRRPLFLDGGVPYYGGYGYGYWGDGVTYSSPPSSPSVNDSDAVVADVQKALTHAGFYHYAVDGFWGLSTENAIEAYQRANRLPVTGTIDEPLLRALGLAY
ncbi:MAG TPA: peptidoglycan-binding domain-containing protein [Chthoniobacteraceae bacterium]|jgi:hypothetical protein|nr:peptidoglycan-binding domain-containing protein [Chthoniobacteraceae bacterium]